VSGTVKTSPAYRRGCSECAIRSNHAGMIQTRS
jgi:hypothetical protein